MSRRGTGKRQKRAGGRGQLRLGQCSGQSLPLLAGLRYKRLPKGSPDVDLKTTFLRTDKNASLGLKTKSAARSPYASAGKLAHCKLSCCANGSSGLSFRIAGGSGNQIRSPRNRERCEVVVSGGTTDTGQAIAAVRSEPELNLPDRFVRSQVHLPPARALGQAVREKAKMIAP